MQFYSANEKRIGYNLSLIDIILREAIKYNNSQLRIILISYKGITSYEFNLHNLYNIS